MEQHDLEFDPEFEFEAPMYYDFLTMTEYKDIDQWFSS